MIQTRLVLGAHERRGALQGNSSKLRLTLVIKMITCNYCCFRELNFDCYNYIVNFSFARFDVENVGMKKLDRLKRGWGRAGRGPGEAG